MTTPTQSNDTKSTTQNEAPTRSETTQEVRQQDGSKRIEPNTNQKDKTFDTKTVAHDAESAEETSRLTMDQSHDTESATRQPDPPTNPRPLSPKDIETTAQFIEYVYSKKGKVKPTLTPQISKAISSFTTITADELNHLLLLARGDKTLSVPRSLLLDSQQHYVPDALQNSLREFIHVVMSAHPLFSNTRASAALRNLPDTLSEQDIFVLCQRYTPDADKPDNRLTKTELNSLRINSAYLFATWIAIQRGRSIEELSKALYKTLWLPSADELPNERDRLRALTNVDEVAGVGLACKRFDAIANDATTRYQKAEKDLEIANARLQQAEAQLDTVTQRADDLQTELEALHQTTAEQLRNIKDKHATEIDHLRRDLRDLRGRLYRELTKAQRELETGLSALRFTPPKTHIMNERAEEVVKLLSSEIGKLKG